MAWSPDSIKQLRKDRRESQTEFARVLGVDRTTISRWETGEVEVSTLGESLLDALAHVPPDPTADYLRGVQEAARVVRDALATLEQRLALADAAVIASVLGDGAAPVPLDGSSHPKTDPAATRTGLRLHKTDGAPPLPDPD